MHAAVIFPCFAPFHRARLERAAEVGRDNGFVLSGIQVADRQRDYNWSPSHKQTGSGLQAFTLFESTDYFQLSRRNIRMAMHRLLDSLQPEVVVLPGWSERSALTGLSWCLNRSIPSVMLSDSQRRDQVWRRSLNWLRSGLLKQANAVLVAGGPQRRYVVELGFESQRCFEGCDVVDNEFFGLGHSTGGASETRGRVILSCLRLLRRKNIFFCLDVLARQATDWEWWIAGYGPQEPEIAGRIIQLGLQERVRLLGPVDYDRLPELYRSASIYLQPSLFEPWGLAVNEAMASGLPVLVSEACGCAEDLVVEGVNGYRFDPTDALSLAAALDRFASSPSRLEEMGQASREIIAPWGLDRFAEGFWNACRTALEPRSGPRNGLVTKLITGVY